MKTDSGQKISDVNDPWSHLHLRDESVGIKENLIFVFVSELVLNPVGWRKNISFLSPSSRCVFD